jgi:hypothetical protein
MKQPKPRGTTFVSRASMFVEHGASDLIEQLLLIHR